MTNLKNAVAAAVITGVSSAVANPATAATGEDREVITRAVLNQVEPIIMNATNQEPFYQSKVTIGAVVTLIAATYGLGLDFTDGIPPSVDSLSAQLGTIAGAVTVLYGRWISNRPIGR